ncbi:LTA synthase family protein [Salmonella enterica]|nr:LTA synthase family protein [Salmonella enterica]
MIRACIKIYFPYFISVLLFFCFLFYFNKMDVFPFFLGESFCIYATLLYFEKRIIRGIIWSSFMVIAGFQMASLYTSGDLIIPLTLSNAGEYKALGFNLLIKLFFIVFIFFLFSLPLYSRVFYCYNPYYKFICLMAVCLPLINGPLLMFGKTLYAYYQQLTFSPSYNYPEIAKKYLKIGIWNNSSSLLKVTKPNIIIIFAEGMSYSVIDSVNNKGLKLTPNIDTLMDNSLVFRNYYNHTAATFRGLRGQLTSAYQYKDGIGAHNDGFFEISNEKVKATFDKRLVSLPEILSSSGYKTIFLSSTEKNSTLNAMLKTLSFDEVYGMGDFEFYQNDRMTDKQTFLSLKKLVEKNKGNNFFIGVYTSGTHHGMDSPNLRYKDGMNSYYNKFYNFDHQLGEFINYLDSNGLMENTLLIITADHATFPTPAFNRAFDTDAKYFIDTIPLIIFGAGIKHHIYDAKGANSLALAPTILNILNINNRPNYFLGCSLLDVKCNSRFYNISAIGNSFFMTGPEKYPNYNVKELNVSEEILNFYNVSG